ncbi:MAG TPA: fatty acid desaturase [Rhizomicrobium sp.]|jgi:fatty acid desaturase
MAETAAALAPVKTTEAVAAAGPIKMSAIAGALCIGAASLLSLGILPILLGGLVQAGRLTQVGVGQAAMLETFLLACGAAFGAFWMGQGAIRMKVRVAALALAAINVATAHATSTELVLVDRTVAGLFAGLLLGAANAIIVRGKNPGRLAGILLGLGMLPQVAAGYLMPVYLIPAFGPAGGFYALAAGVLVAAIGIAGLPAAVQPLTEQASASEPAGQPVILLFAAVVLQSCGLGAAWTYLELLSHQQGFAASVIGIAIAGSIAFQVAAAWLAAWLSPRFAKWPALLTLIAVQTITTALAIVTGSPPLFIAAVCIFGAMPPAMQPFQIGEMIALDKTRQAALLVGPMILFGNGLGPLIASGFATETDVRIAFWSGVAMTAVSALLYVFAAYRAAHPVPRKTPMRIDRAALMVPPPMSPAEERGLAKELSPKIAWPTFALAIVLPLAMAVLMWLGWTRLVPLWTCAIVLSFLSYACYTLVHEATHDNLVPGNAKLRWLNAVVGWIGALGEGFNWPLLMRTHMLHHSHTNGEDDPDIWVKGGFAELIMKALYQAVFVQTVPLFALRTLAPADYRTATRGLRGSEELQADIVPVAVFILLVASIATGHFQDWLFLLFIPTRIGGILLAIYFQWLPHHPFDSKARYTNTRIGLWPAAGALTLGQSYHLMHHLWPGVPFYNYGRFYRRMHPTLLAKGSRIEGHMVGAYAKDCSAG